MNIEQINNRTGGYFRMMDNDVEAGRLNYSWAGIDNLVIQHTDVVDSYAHHGIGRELVLATVQYARANHVKITPVCLFARSMFSKEKELNDVLFQ